MGSAPPKSSTPANNRKLNTANKGRGWRWFRGYRILSSPTHSRKSSCCFYSFIADALLLLVCSVWALWLMAAYLINTFAHLWPANDYRFHYRVVYPTTTIKSVGRLLKYSGTAVLHALPGDCLGAHKWLTDWLDGGEGNTSDEHVACIWCLSRVVRGRKGKRIFDISGVCQSYSISVKKICKMFRSVLLNG